MSDDFDQQYPRQREPLYGKRRAMTYETPLDDDVLASPEVYEISDPIDDTSVDIFYLLDRLEELVSIGKRVPFSGKVMVEENEFLGLVDQLRIAVPNEIKQAQRVIKERQTIIAESHQEAVRISDAARQRAEYYVSKEGILNEARLRGELILQDAVRRREVTLGTIDDYAIEQFERAEQALRDGMQIIEDALQDASDLLRVAQQNVGK